MVRFPAKTTRFEIERFAIAGRSDEKKPKSTDDSEIPSPVEGKPAKIEADRPISIESFAESSCPKWFDDRINVHFILHTHDDPGWLKTPDQYYYDGKPSQLCFPIYYF